MPLRSLLSIWVALLPLLGWSVGAEHPSAQPAELVCPCAPDAATVGAEPSDAEAACCCCDGATRRTAPVDEDGCGCWAPTAPVPAAPLVGPPSVERPQVEAATAAACAVPRPRAVARPASVHRVASEPRARGGPRLLASTRVYRI